MKFLDFINFIHTEVKSDCKRILIVTPDPNGGGSSRSMLTVAKYLKENRYDVMVVITKKGFVTDSLDKLGINYEINPYIVLNIWPWILSWKDVLLYVPRLIRYFLFSLLSVFKLRKIAKKFRPDLVYSNSSLIMCGFRVASSLDLPHLWHIRDFGNKDFGWTFFPTNEYKNRLMRATPSISITKEINQYYHIEKSGIVVYNGLKSKSDSSKASPMPIHCFNPYFLFVGGITENKGCTDLINAFCEYRKKGGSYDLLICGSGENYYVNKLKSILKKNHDVENHVYFEGQVSNVDDYMMSAQAIIVPSKYEAFGRITAEAMFDRCLIIGRDVGGTKEQFDLGLRQNGHEIGLRFTTVEDLQACMHEVESMSQTERDSYIMPAFLTATDNFTIDVYTERIQDYIEQVINPSYIVRK